MELVIRTNVGETTCAAEPGKFCRFLGTRGMKAIPHCLLNCEDLFENSDGWVQRSKKCLEEFRDRSNDCGLHKVKCPEEFPAQTIDCNICRLFVNQECDGDLGEGCTKFKAV